MTQIFTGCLPDPHDGRDYQYSALCGASPIQLLPSDLRPDMPPIFSQTKGSCTAEATSASVAYQYNIRQGKNFLPSRSFEYYMTRLLEQNTYKDAGASLVNACKAAVKYGVCWDAAYPETNGIAVEPQFITLVTAMDNKANSYYRLQSFMEIIDALNRKIPVIFSTNVHEWEVGSDGICRNALTWSKKSGSGHAMLIVGYQPNFMIDGKQTPVFIIRNSWGTYWGDKGYAYIPAQQLYDCNMGDKWVVFIDTIPPDQPLDQNPQETVVIPQDNTIFSIIIDSCATPQAAITMRDFYNKNSYDCMIKQFQSSMGTRWIVVLNAVFDSVEKAKEKQNEMLAKNLRNYIGVI